MCLGWGYTEPYHPARRNLHRISSLGSNVGRHTVLEPHALRRTGQSVDVVARSVFRTTAACSACSPRVGGPSLHDSPEVATPLFDSLPRYYTLIRLLIALHARQYGFCLPEPARTSPCTGETSQVPYKELTTCNEGLRLREVLPMQATTPWRCCLLVSELDRHLELDPVSQLNTRPVSPL